MNTSPFDTQTEIYENLQSYLDQLANTSPAPAGGSALAVSSAIAVSLVIMAARTTLKKTSYAEYHAKMIDVISQLETLQEDLLDAAKNDSQVFLAFLGEQKKHLKDQQESKMNTAIHEIIQSPVTIAEKNSRLIDLALIIAKFGNINAIVDVSSAILMADGNIQGAILTAKANTKLLNENENQHYTQKLNKLENKNNQQRNLFNKILQERSNLSLPG